MNKQNIENFTYEELFNFHGYEVDYIIRNSKGKGKISVDKVQNRIYICQNEQEGALAPDKLNFKYSYLLNNISINSCCWKNCIENIYLPEKSMNKEELLEEAKRRYPVGTIIKLPNGETTNVKENLYFDITDLSIIWNSGYGRIYDNGKWAEIVSKPEEKNPNWKELQDKAWEIFKNVKEGDKYISTNGDEWVATKNAVKSNYTDSGAFIECGLGFLWEAERNGEIDVYGKLIPNEVEEKPQFEVGKWYRLDNWSSLGVNCIENSDHRIKYNQYINSDGKLKNSNSELTLNLHLIKEVTKEIQQYLPDGHPDKIEKPKSLIGRYLKALVDYPNGGFVKKGEYGKITSNYNADFTSQKRYACQVAISKLNDSNTIYDGKYELMPEGFEPKNEIVKEEIPEYVECVSYFKERNAKGKIYNTKKDKPEKSSELTWEQILIECGRLKDGSFKPSTKEAYDKQQRALRLGNDKVDEEKWIPKAGDWIVRTFHGDYANKVTKDKCYQVLKDVIDNYVLVLDDNGKEDFFSLSKFRKAEPHEIPIVKHVKINPSEIVEHFEKEIKPEIDSWCIQATKENQEFLIKNINFFKTDRNYKFRDFGSYYGITKKGKFHIYNDSSYFDKVLTTEEFCKKFNITESYKYVHIDFSKNEIIQKNQQSKINKVKVELIPVKKLIKN